MRITISIVVVMCVSGCEIAVPATALSIGQTAYTIASVGTFVVTDKSLTDHIISATVDGDCNIVNLLDNKFYCEMNADESEVYNRSGL